MKHDDDAPSWPQDTSFPTAQPVLYVAFAFDPIISPPRDHDPRQYKAGACHGAFMTYRAAQIAVENSRPTGGYVWDQMYGKDDPTLFLRDGNTFAGYVEVVPLERRAEGDRRHI